MSECANTVLWCRLLGTDNELLNTPLQHHELRKVYLLDESQFQSPFETRMGRADIIVTSFVTNTHRFFDVVFDLVRDEDRGCPRVYVQVNTNDVYVRPFIQSHARRLLCISVIFELWFFFIQISDVHVPFHLRGLAKRKLSVRLSNACIVTKRKKNLSRFLYHTKDHLA